MTTIEKNIFKFRTPDGLEPHFDLPTTVFTARRSRLGTVVMRFPAPFDDIEVTYGEKVSPSKWARMREALDALTLKEQNG